MGVGGCAAQTRPLVNPSFPLTMADARAALDEAAAHPKPLERPLVILGGFLDPGLGGLAVGGAIRRHVADERIVTVSFLFCRSFDECRERVIESVDRAFPTS